MIPRGSWCLWHRRDSHRLAPLELDVNDQNAAQDLSPVGTRWLSGRSSSRKFGRSDEGASQELREPWRRSTLRRNSATYRVRRGESVGVPRPAIYCGGSLPIFEATTSYLAMPLAEDTLFNAIVKRVVDCNRYSADVTKAELRSEIGRLAATKPDQAAYLRVFADYQLGESTYHDAVNALQSLAFDPARDPKARANAYSHLAKLTLFQVPAEENDQFRSEALRLANETAQPLFALIIATNWAIASVERNEFSRIDERFGAVQTALTNLPSEHADSREAREVAGRLSAMRGKVILRKLPEATDLDDFLARYEVAREYFHKALAAHPTDAHRQVNTRLELAVESMDIGFFAWPTIRNVARTMILEAAEGRNAHQCTICDAYRHEALAKQQWYDALTAIHFDALTSQRLLMESLSEAEKWEADLARLLHPRAGLARTFQQRVNEMLSFERRPSRIFLSHSTADKTLVRPFENALKEVRYEPWLDESAMTAGVRLHPGLKAGLQNSCAAVFFLTPNFKDERYLAEEVAIALEEKNRRPDQFAIIPIDFSTLGVAIQVPDRLKEFVRITWSTDMAVLVQLIRALPIRPGRPLWPSAPATE
jgi:hypothetical protein